MCVFILTPEQKGTYIWHLVWTVIRHTLHSTPGRIGSASNTTEYHWSNKHTHFIEQQATKLCTCMLKRDYITFKVTYTEWFHCSNGTALAVSWCSQPSHALSLALDTLKYGEEHLVVWPTTVPLCLHHSHHLWQAHSCQDLLTLVLRTHWSEERRGSWTMW